MSKYDKELDTRTPEYEKAINEKRSGRERDESEEGDRQDDRDEPEETREPRTRPPHSGGSAPRR